MPTSSIDETTESRRRVATQYKSLFKYFAVRFCIAVTIGAILLALVELYAYTRYDQIAPDMLEPAIKLDLAGSANAEKREYWKEYEQSNKVFYHQYVLWRRAPYRGKSISIDQDGVRRTLHTRCDDKTFTIWMFGDSVMWGDGSPDSETIPSLVAEDYEKSGRAVCIVNYGEKGWSNTQEMVGLIEQLKHTKRRPDIVLFYDGGTEAFAAYQNGQADVHSNFGMFRNFLENWGAAQRASFSYFRQTNTYRLLKKIAAKQPFHQSGDVSGPQPDTEKLSTAVIENYMQNMDIIRLLAEQYGFRPVYAWYPNLAVGHKQLTLYEQQILLLQYQQFPGLSSMYQAVYDHSNAIKDPDFYNFADIVDNQKGSLYLGISHMGPEGDHIVADRLFDILDNRQANSTEPASAIVSKR
jgi:hypothetical protein